MYKKLLIVASILLVSGGASLAWVLDQRRMDRQEIAEYQSRYGAQTDEFVRQYNEWLQTPPRERTEMSLVLDKDGKAKTREQLRLEQQGRFKANVDKLVDGVVTNPSLADLLYGENWQLELNNYKERQDFNRIVLISSAVSTSAGVLVYVIWLLLLAARLIIKAAKGSKELAKRARSAVKDRGADEAEAETGDTSDEDGSDQDAVDKEPENGAEEPANKPESRPKIPVSPVTAATVDRPRRNMGSLTQRPLTVREREKVVLFSDDRPLAVETPPSNEPVRLDLSEQAKPIDNTLDDLTQQVSAIREYAANQQDRLEKLQDGYDWNIIRTFCLRVIRCIDNIQNRIIQLANKKNQRIHLEEVRDELIFALESSGIEQFEPEINTEYRGNEKIAEAVKERVNCDDPEQAGWIAEVVRPGYQYFIDEENTKIVRPAQVKLYA